MKTLLKTLALMSLPFSVISCNNSAYNSNSKVEINVKQDSIKKYPPYNTSNKIIKSKGPSVRLGIGDLDQDGILEVYTYTSTTRSQAYK